MFNFSDKTGNLNTPTDDKLRYPQCCKLESYAFLYFFLNYTLSDPGEATLFVKAEIIYQTTKKYKRKIYSVREAFVSNRGHIISETVVKTTSDDLGSALPSNGATYSWNPGNPGWSWHV